MKSKAIRTPSLYALAALMLLSTAGVWLGTGAYRGWSKTELTVMQHDEVTGIDYPAQQKGFVAGVDFLGAGVGLSLAIAATGFLLRPKTA